MNSEKYITNRHTENSYKEKKNFFLFKFQQKKHFKKIRQKKIFKLVVGECAIKNMIKKPKN